MVWKVTGSKGSSGKPDVEKTIVAFMDELRPSSLSRSRGEKLTAKLGDKYGYKFLLFGSKTVLHAFTTPIDLVVARAPLFHAVGYYLSRLRRVPLINDFRDPYTLFYTRKLFPTLFLLHRNLCDAISVTMRAYVEEFGLDPDKVFYNPNAAPLEWTMLPDREPKEQVCFIGNLHNRQYAFPLMLEAFRRLVETRPQLKLVIGGDGPLLPEVRQLAIDKGIGGKVQFLGKVTYEEVPGLISDSLLGIALNPWLGQKHVEYAACSRPCVGVAGRIDSEGVPWILTARPSPSDVAEKMRTLILDESTRTYLGELGRREVQRFYNWDRMADLWHQVIQRLIN